MKWKTICRKTLMLLIIAALLLPSMNGIESQAASKPALSAKKLTLKVGKKVTLKVRKVKKKKIKSIRFSSNKKKVVKVSAKGRVTARKAGNAKITCKITLKNKKKYKLICKVKVINAQIKPTQKPQGQPTINPGNTVDSQKPTEQPGNTADPQKPTEDPDNTAGPQQPTEDPDNTAGPQKPTEDPDNTTGPQQPTEDPDNTAGPQKPTEDPDNTTGPQQPTKKPDVTTSPQKTPRPFVIPTVQPSKIETVDNGQMRENMTAFDIQHEMGLGINLGNTMESAGDWINSSSVTKYETAWGSPVIKKEMIAGMRQAGFRSIRIPVSWSNMMSKDGTYAINNAYFDRVEEIMEYAFQEEMYVIVNIHYDGGWWSRFGSKDEQERTEAMNQYISMWTQIANRFQRYSDHLIFESANEELGESLNSTKEYKNSGYYSSTDDLYTLTNTINQTFVDIVRKTGGNNATRYLLIAGYNTDISKTCDSRFRMPKDTIANHLMISIHYYGPSTYCLAEDIENEWGYQDSWGTDADIAAMKSELNNMKLCFVDKGVPVVIGEYGGACLTKINNVYVKKTGRTLFYRTLCEYALDHGMCPVLWDIQYGEDPLIGIYNRLTAQISDSAEAAMFLEMEQYGENAAVYEPPAPASTFMWAGTISCAGWNPGDIVTDMENSNFVMSKVGGCYKLSGIDWSVFSHPVLKMHADFTTGSASCWLAKEDQINKEDQYWYYIENSVNKAGDWTFANDVTYDLSAMQLTDAEDLYLCVKGGTDFEGKVTLTIMEKE